jgi:hypothetical protein
MCFEKRRVEIITATGGQIPYGVSSVLAVLCGLVSEGLSRRASRAIPFGIVGEGTGQKRAAAALGIAFAGLPTLLPRSVEVHTAVRRRLELSRLTEGTRHSNRFNGDRNPGYFPK